MLRRVNTLMQPVVNRRETKGELSEDVHDICKACKTYTRWPAVVDSQRSA